MVERGSGSPDDAPQDHKNRATELRRIGTNFLLVCFDVENLYRDYLLPHWAGSGAPDPPEDPFYDEDQRREIERLLGSYRLYMEGNGEEPFPESSCMFQMKFFSFVHSNREEALERISRLVTPRGLLERFEEKLSETYERTIHNVNFTETSAKDKVIHMLDEFYLHMLGMSRRKETL